MSKFLAWIGSFVLNLLLIASAVFVIGHFSEWIFGEPMTVENAFIAALFAGATLAAKSE